MFLHFLLQLMYLARYFRNTVPLPIFCILGFFVWLVNIIYSCLLMLSLHSPWVAGMRRTAQWPTHGAIPEEGLSRGCWWSPCCHWMFYWVPGQFGDVKLCSLPNLPSACTKPVTDNGRTAKENLLHDIYCNAWRCFPATDVGCKALLYILEVTVQVFMGRILSLPFLFCKNQRYLIWENNKNNISTIFACY